MISWIVNGVEYSLDDGVNCYSLGTDGLGLMPLHRIEERGPLQHGSTDRGYRLDPRVISLALEVFGDTQVELWQKRAALIAMFKPRDTAGIFKWTLGTITRQIDAMVVDGLSFSSKDRSGWTQKTAVALKCGDPTWYDPVAKASSLIVQIGQVTSGAIPMAVPTEIGASGLNEILLINYQGTVDSYPHLVRITGPITSPIMTNLITGEKIDFSGITIAAGDYYDIDLRYGFKTVVDSSGANKNANVAVGSDLSTWRILAHPDAPNGINPIRVTGSGESNATRIDITNYDRFLGI